MSYPAQGIDQMYRNPAGKVRDFLLIIFCVQVAEFLNKEHGDKYWIINTSERATYNTDLFGGRVTAYHWPDHHAPPLNYLFQIAKQAYDWLMRKFTQT